MSAPLTTNVILTTCDVAFAAPMVTVPLKVPGVVRTDVTIETLAVPAIVPGATGLADSHDPPDIVAARAVKAMPEVPVTLIDCAAGVLPPMV